MVTAIVQGGDAGASDRAAARWEVLTFRMHVLDENRTCYERDAGWEGSGAQGDLRDTASGKTTCCIAAWG